MVVVEGRGVVVLLVVVLFVVVNLFAAFVVYALVPQALTLDLFLHLFFGF